MPAECLYMFGIFTSFIELSTSEKKNEEKGKWLCVCLDFGADLTICPKKTYTIPSHFKWTRNRLHENEFSFIYFIPILCVCFLLLFIRRKFNEKRVKDTKSLTKQWKKNSTYPLVFICHKMNRNRGGKMRREKKKRTHWKWNLLSGS